MRFKHPLPSRLPGVRVGARVVRDIGLDAGPRLAVQAARASVARMRRAMDRAVAQSPQSLFLRELMAQPGSVGAICASSPRLATRMAEQVDPATHGLVVELGGVLAQQWGWSAALLGAAAAMALAALFSPCVPAVRAD